MAGLNVSMEFDGGLDEALRRLGDHKNIIDSELRKAESDGLTLLRDEVKRLAPGNKMPNSIETMTDGLIGKVGSVAKTAYSIEMGRPNSADGTNLWPSIEKIEGWLKRKGLAFGSSVSVKSHRPVKFKKGSTQEQQLRADAIAVIKAMKAAGSTKPQLFIQPAAQNMSRQITDRFSRALTDAAKRLVK